MQYDYAELCDILQDLWTCGEQVIKQHNRRTRLHVTRDQIVREQQRKDDPNHEPTHVAIGNHNGIDCLEPVVDIGVKMFLEHSERIQSWAEVYREAEQDFKTVDWSAIVDNEPKLIAAVAVIGDKIRECTDDRNADRQIGVISSEIAAIMTVQKTCQLRREMQPQPEAEPEVETPIADTEFLQLEVDFDNQKIGRAGHDVPVYLSSRANCWHIFKVLYRLADNGADREMILNGYEGEADGLRSEVGELKKLLHPLDVQTHWDGRLRYLIDGVSDP
jgi:hypothetical protein